MPVRLRQLGARVARLSAFVLLATAGFHLLVGRMVAAETESSLLELGTGLAQLGVASGTRGERVLELNGARILFAVETRGDSVAAVLERAQAACAPGQDHRLRGGDGVRGFVVCPVAPPSAGPVIGEVREGGGWYRYVYAEADGAGTLTISVELDRSIDLSALFPAAGDAPGVDAPDVPRPPRARRRLSALESGSPQQMTMYVAEQSDPAALEAWYRARLPAFGWRLLDGERPAGPARVLLAERGGTLTALVLAPDQRSGGASAVVLTSLDHMEEGK